MPHQIAYKRLSRTDGHRKALLRNLATSFFKYEKIETTSTKAKEITGKLGIEPARRVQDLSDQEVLQIREAIDAGYTVEGDLRRQTAMNIKRLMDLACYRGLRHRKGLPVRGQRTHTNARTRKGKAKPIAGKKK